MIIEVAAQYEGRVSITIERRFPKGKTAFFLEFANVIGCAQIRSIKMPWLVVAIITPIANVPIFGHSGDTKGDTKRLHLSRSQAVR